MAKFIGIAFAEKFPMFSKGEHIKDVTDRNGPFYEANHVLSWHFDTPRNRAWLASSVEYWQARGYTPRIETTTTQDYLANRRAYK